MRVIYALIKKEFLQVFRNKIMTKIIVIVPIMQLVILVFAANFEVKNLTLCVIDRDHSTVSHDIVRRMVASGYFIPTVGVDSYTEAMEVMRQERADVIIEIPSHFERDIYRMERPRMSVTINAINGMKAGLASSYVGRILAECEVEQVLPFGVDEGRQTNRFEVTYSNWYNPMLDYKSLMLPGVLCVLITVIGILITALNIVREKEIGTIEQLNVTPIGKVQFIVGKLVPFGIISMFQLTLGLLVSVFVFGLHIEGSLWLLYGVVLVYMLVVLGLGFLISTVSDTQSQAMFVTLFFIFVFILLSGLFTPIESMPEWTQRLNLLNPTGYLIEMVRLIILKGSGFADIQRQFYTLLCFAVGVNAAVVWRFRKTS